MAKFEDFKEGEAVAHIQLGDGVVMAIKGGEVIVTYDCKTANGHHPEGRYDRNWFGLHPHYLFHRHTQSA